MMLNPRFHGTKWRKFRMNCFLLTGFFACAPIVHGTIRWGMEFVRGTGVPYYLAEVLLILIGCYFYEVHNMIFCLFFSVSIRTANNASVYLHQRRFPERYYPGRFDFWWQSHTIWHLFVVGAVCMHLLGLLSALDYDYHNRSTCHV
jgi:adiponectin receptor